jgi:PEGA domain
MKKTCTQLIILVVAALIVLPVAVTGQNTTNFTAVPTTMATGVVSTVTTVVPTNTTAPIPVTSTTTGPTANTTPLSNTPTETVPGTTATTIMTTATIMTTTIPVTTTVPVTQMSVGNLTVASSPMGASVLIDGVYYGVTPLDLTGIPAGNHMVRLALSGYYDYEGTIYIVPGQESSAFGTLPPVTGYYTEPATAPQTPAPVITIMPAETVQPTQTPSPGPWENPTVLAAVIGGLITAAIGASATIFTHIWTTKKETKEETKEKEETKKE